MRPAPFPAVDDRAVVPETGTEMLGGEVRKVLPALPPHAERQCDIAYVIRSDLAPGYVASTELLTRVDHESDFATDVCIHKAGLDPTTGSRYLEELAFEVKHRQSSADLTARARKLSRRGVRRIFAIHVKERAGAIHAGPVAEWLASEDRWLKLNPVTEIVDRCLAQPLKVQALLDATAADDQVARALLAQNNRVLASARQEALEAQARALADHHAREMEAQARALADHHAREMEAQARALADHHAREMEARDAANARKAILELCDLLAIEVTAERQAQMDVMASGDLAALRSTIHTQRRWPENLAGSIT